MEEVNKKVGSAEQKSGARAARRAAAGGRLEGADGAAEQIGGAAGELVARLHMDYPELRFRVGKRFMFRSPRTVVVEALDGADGGLEWELQLLHEVGHALAGHRDYRTDPERLVMEREAWERARGLCEAYNIRYDEELVEAELDTYRDWLHQKSRCRRCGLTRYQTRDGRWHCPGCEL